VSSRARSKNSYANKALFEEKHANPELFVKGAFHTNPEGGGTAVCEKKLHRIGKITTEK